MPREVANLELTHAFCNLWHANGVFDLPDGRIGGLAPGRWENHGLVKAVRERGLLEEENTMSTEEEREARDYLVNLGKSGMWKVAKAALLIETLIEEDLTGTFHGDWRKVCDRAEELETLLSEGHIEIGFCVAALSGEEVPILWEDTLTMYQPMPEPEENQD